MRKVLTFAIAGCLAGLTPAGRTAEMEMHGGQHAHGSTHGAVEMVKKGVAYIDEHGEKLAYAEFTREDGQFRNGAHYLVVYRLDGLVLAHGQNWKMVDKNLIRLRDLDGKPFIKETVELAKSQAVFWMDHRFINPVTKKVEPMRMYCERRKNTVICSGHFM